MARLKVGITGASGFIGSALRLSLAADGHEAVALARRGVEPAWDPAALKGLDAVVHLAGESIAAGRWTAARKAAIRDSRVNGTGFLAGALAELKDGPKVLVSASAIGYYGPGDAPVDETAAAGSDFLAGVCRAWEAAADEARAAGLRVVHPRIGVVLGLAGGALAKMLTPFSMGLGGPVGDGRQWMSWIALEDAVAALKRCVTDAALEGPVNLAAPGAVRNADFAAVLGRVLGRPAVMPLPAFAVRLMFGEMGEALLLSGQRVVPARLKNCGFEFATPDLEGALRRILGR